MRIFQGISGSRHSHGLLQRNQNSTRGTVLVPRPIDVVHLYQCVGQEWDMGTIAFRNSKTILSMHFLSLKTLFRNIGS